MKQMRNTTRSWKNDQRILFCPWDNCGLFRRRFHLRLRAVHFGGCLDRKRHHLRPWPGGVAVMTFRIRAVSLDELHDKIACYKITMAPMGKVSVGAGRVGGFWVADVSVEAWL